MKRKYFYAGMIVAGVAGLTSISCVKYNEVKREVNKEANFENDFTSELTIKDSYNVTSNDFNMDSIYSSKLLDSGYRFKDIHFQQLQEVNEDTVGWISIDDVIYDEPIVQGINNNEYLDKDFYGNKSKEGTIFLDSMDNSLKFEYDDLDRVSYIYGHHMRNGTKFANLVKYKDQEYYDNHPYGVLYSINNGVYLIEFTNGYIIDGNDVEHLYTNNFSEEDYLEYLNYIEENSTFNTDIDLTLEDKAVALITCEYSGNNNRYVLVGKLKPQYVEKLENGEYVKKLK